jgi:hypothetical protein
MELAISSLNIRISPFSNGHTAYAAYEYCNAKRKQLIR